MGMLLFSALLGGTLTAFGTTHLRLMKSNLTTIESIEEKNPIRVIEKPPIEIANITDGDNSVLIERVEEGGQREEEMAGASPQSVSRHVFDLGEDENIEEVLGSNVILWFLPVWTTRGDGVYFKTNTQ
jgi:hypothetical protein